MTKAEANDLVQRHAEALGEHFENVQILASYRKGNCTVGVGRGVGDWYARIGMADDMLSRAHADNIGEAVQEHFDDPPSEDWKQNK